MKRTKELPEQTLQSAEGSIRIKGAAHTRHLVYMALGVCLLAVCTWISIPAAVPFTMQTFAVFAILGLLGGKRGTLCLLCYLLIGLCGLPIFSGFRGGPAVLLGSTGGYLVGFLLACLCYWLLTHLFGEGLLTQMSAMLLGLALVYLFGTLWFMTVYAANTGAIGFVSTLSLCVFPFVIPDVLKIVLALLLVRRVKPWLRKEQ